MRKRVPRVKRIPKPGCVICKKNICVDEINKNPVYINLQFMRVTRRRQKLVEDCKEFIILETYRCMPLLGNEEEVVPDWDVHIVHYTIVYVKKHMKQEN